MASTIPIITLLLLSANILKAVKVDISVDIIFFRSNLISEMESRNGCNAAAVKIMELIRQSLDIFSKGIRHIQDVADEQKKIL